MSPIGRNEKHGRCSWPAPRWFLKLQRRDGRYRSATKVPQTCDNQRAQNQSCGNEHPGPSRFPCDGWLVLDSIDLRDEAIASFRNRLDVLLRISTVAQGLPDRRHVVGEVRFFDDGVGPDGPHELVLRQQPARIGRQERKQIVGLGSQRHGLTALQDDAFIGDEGHRAELENLRCAVHAGMMRHFASRRKRPRWKKGL